MAHDRKYRDSLAHSIKVLRGTRTQKEIAQAAGIPTSTWCKIEQGRQVPRDSTFSKIAKSLGCTAAELERLISESVLRRLDQDPETALDAAGDPESAARRLALTLHSIDGLRQQLRTLGEHLDTLELDLRALGRDFPKPAG